MGVSRCGAGVVAAAGLAAVAGVAPLAAYAVPAHSAGSVSPVVRVVASRLHVRTLPATDALSFTALGRGQSVRVLCKAPGQDIDGNSWWYSLGLLPNGYTPWISARYASNVSGRIPRCTTGTPLVQYVATAGAPLRSYPSMTAPVVGRLKLGQKVQVVWHASHGPEEWYLTSTGRWVFSGDLEAGPLG